MKEYPSILKDIVNVPVYSFNKLDGSNIRSEWSPKKGFYKFGSRTRLLDETDPMLGSSLDIIRAKYEKDLSDIFKKQRYLSVTCFFEYWGPRSFAGQHHPEDQKTATLFDINPYKKGILMPDEYLKHFGHLDIAQMLYHGNPNSDFIDMVKNGTLPGMTFEGVICKSKFNKKTPQPLMFKIKSLAWLEKLKLHCAGDENLFKQLA
jgi:hypothetical protein